LFGDRVVQRAFAFRRGERLFKIIAIEDDVVCGTCFGIEIDAVLLFVAVENKRKD